MFRFFSIVVFTIFMVFSIPAIAFFVRATEWQLVLEYVTHPQSLPHSQYPICHCWGHVTPTPYHLPARLKMASYTHQLKVSMPTFVLHWLISQVQYTHSLGIGYFCVNKL